MDRISNSEVDNGALHNVESFVLGRLSSNHDTRGDISVSIGEIEGIHRHHNVPPVGSSH